jgi:hypothetical protein
MVLLVPSLQDSILTAMQNGAMNKVVQGRNEAVPNPGKQVILPSM